MDTGTLIATIIGAVIAGVFGLITKYLELDFEKKKAEIARGAAADETSEESKEQTVIEAAPQKKEYSWFQRNFRKLSTAGFIVAGVVAVVIIAVIAIPAIIKSNEDGEDDIAVPVMESVTTPAETEPAVKTSAEIMAEQKDAVGLLYGNDDALKGNIFAVEYKNEQYLVTTFRTLLAGYADGNKSFRIDFENHNDILSSDLTLAGYSPLYNVAILKPKNAIDIPAFTLSKNDPLVYSEISAFGTSTSDETARNIAKNGVITQDKREDGSTGLPLLVTDAVCKNMSGAPVLDLNDLTSVVAIVPAIAMGEERILIPVSYIETVLNEMSIPNTTMVSFDADELPEKFPYLWQFPIQTGFEDVTLGKDSEGTYLFQKAGISVEEYNGYSYLVERGFGQALYRGANNDENVVDYGYLEDGYVDDLNKPYFRYNEDKKLSSMTDGKGNTLFAKDYFALYTTGDKEKIVAFKGEVQFQFDGKYICISDENKILKNDFETVPERLKITSNADGYLIRIDDTETGLFAYINNNGSYGVAMDETIGGYFDLTNRKLVNSDMTATITGDNKNIEVYYKATPDVKGKIYFSEDENISVLSIKNNDLTGYKFAGGDMTIFNNADESAYYGKADNALFYGEKNDGYFVNGRGIKISDTYYLIGNFDNGKFDDTYYPFLLDWHDIKKTSEQ
ncbi:MAG: serine protease [Ruminococcus sp.]|jgi:hypothetical protein|nr:serine protease [Ruminococcus sp.]